jgi:hypothetical protein
VQLITPVALGPAAVTVRQERWQLDVTVDSGNGMDWAKLLSTPLVGFAAAVAAHSYCSAALLFSCSSSPTHT